MSTVLAAAAIDRVGSEAQKARYLPGLADGTRIGTLAFLDGNGALGPAGVTVRATPDGSGLRVGILGQRGFLDALDDVVDPLELVRLLAELAAAGNVRTETMQAFTEGDFKAIVR